VIHFPTTTQEFFGLYDKLAEHEGEPAVDPKYILQQFIYWEPLDTALESYKAALPASSPGGLGLEERVQNKYKSMFGTPMPSSSADEPVEAS